MCGSQGQKSSAERASPAVSDTEDHTGAVDRYGNEASDRARDRSGPIAFMARNGVAANLLLLAMLVAGYFS